MHAAPGRFPQSHRYCSETPVGHANVKLFREKKFSAFRGFRLERQVFWTILISSSE
jgi:hypothetical protein